VSDENALYAFVSYNGYVDPDRNASYAPVHWDARFAEVRKLAGIIDPAAFAEPDVPRGAEMNKSVLKERR
jgi:hypothetical protein